MSNIYTKLTLHENIIYSLMYNVIRYFDSDVNVCHP